MKTLINKYDIKLYNEEIFLKELSKNYYENNSYLLNKINNLNNKITELTNNNILNKDKFHIIEIDDNNNEFEILKYRYKDLVEKNETLNMNIERILSENK